MSSENPLLNKYSLVKGAARRARQLQSGAVPTVIPKSLKACRVAQDEILQGHVSFRIGQAGQGGEEKPEEKTEAPEEPEV
jgi:DNA-directed RNA polymerase subunit omega